MTELTNPATGHTVRTDEASAGFWAAAGYKAQQKAPAKKAAPKSEK